MNFLTAPLIADLFLLAILAIGRDEVYGGVIEANNIKPYDIMLFFISLAYIAISIDASGLIRWLAFKVLQKGGGAGHRLFLYLYSFFFVLGSFIGNDPIILSGTAFLAYMTRVSSNIVHPRAWITAQFAIANIASAILVSSNPTNLVLAGAFEIQFIHYTANMIVPVVATAIVLFPFLLYIIFNDERFIPSKINIHELPEEVRNKKPVNPNIPNARGRAEEEENQHINDDAGQLLSLEEIMNPFLDMGGAAFGAVIMAATLITLIALNATGKEEPVFYVTLPAAVVMLVWDLSYGWIHRKETRKIAQDGRKEVEQYRGEQERQRQAQASVPNLSQNTHQDGEQNESISLAKTPTPEDKASNDEKTPEPSRSNTEVESAIAEKMEQEGSQDGLRQRQGLFTGKAPDQQRLQEEMTSSENDTVVNSSTGSPTNGTRTQSHRTLTIVLAERYRWSQETFPTMTAVISHLPFALIPFAFCMFTLVQALVTKGWIAVFAHGWDHWVTKTGTVGAIGGMGFLSVILCNVSTMPDGTNFTLVT
jgi:Na+/H+ antiporter NhaD/arsenite permease-like protein